MYDYPTIRLDLQGMKQSIVNALSAYHEDIEKNVKAQLETILKEFDFGEAVTAVAKQVILESVRNAVEYYFKYGEGTKIIKEIVQKSIVASLKGIDQQVFIDKLSDELSKRE